jgi:hypothetical protein
MSSQRQDSPPGISLKKRVLSVPTLISFGVAAAIVFLLAARFDVDWAATWDNVRAINPWLYAVAIVSYYLSFVFRGLRWRVLAQNAASDAAPGPDLPPWPRFAQLIAVGWFVNAIAWLRLGDAYRSYALAADSKRSFPWSLGTILAERVMDMAIIFGLTVVGAIFLSSSSDSSASIYILVAASAMALALVGFIAAMKLSGERVVRFLPGRFQDIYARFRQGTLGSFRRMPLLITLGLMAWVVETARIYFVVEALGLDIGLALVLVVAMGHAILSVVPTPGGVGVVEPGLTGLLLLGLGRLDAVSVTVVDRSITYLSVIIVGFVAFLAGQVWQARRNRRPSPPTALAVGQKPGRDA